MTQLRDFACLSLISLPLLASACGQSGADGVADEGISPTGSPDTDTDAGDDADAGDELGETDAGCDERCGNECCGANEACDPDTLTCVIDCGEQEPCGLESPTCCGDGELCYVGQCIVPGDSCNALSCATQTESDCEANEICDGELGLCVPNLADESCTFTPEAGVFDPVPRWSWGVRKPRSCTDAGDCQISEICDAGSCTVSWPHIEPGPDDFPTHHQAMATPVVADLDGDCIPEVLFNSFAASGWATDGILRALRGDSGEPVWSLGDAEWRSDGSAIPAVGDIDYDGDLEIVNMGGDNRLQLIDHTGTPVWKTADPYPGNLTSGAPSLTNIDQTGDVEIAYGRGIYDSAGNLVWIGDGGIGTNSSYAVLSCVADLDGDSRPELIGGGTAYTFTGTVGVDFAGQQLWQSGGDGFCGVADFQLDGVPEVVVVRQGSIDVLDGPTGELLAQISIPGGGMGGPPNIADFDGDGFPDIGLAGGARYVVVQFDGVDTLTQLWSAATKDVSSNRTGSSVFDFDGDGRNEVIYGDEWFLRIYPGTEPDCSATPPGPGCDQDMTDDEILFIDIQSSGTRVEYPVIADVDGDFKAEIVVSTNNIFDAGDIGDAGVEVFEDRLDNWVGTLPIWNQHTYHVTNVDARGGIPVIEDANWLVPAGNPYNSYRRNTQGAVENCAPDLVAQDLELVGACGPELKLSARVCNQGCLGVGPGVSVSFTEATAGLLGTAQTEVAIPAGGCATVELEFAAPGTGPFEVEVIADDDGQQSGSFNECIEDNNDFGPLTVCETIG